jgi:exo-beta-1,3-glucanase (GH17 family)
VAHSAEALEAQRIENDAEAGRLIDLARAYQDLIFAVAVGNESTVDWTDHMVPLGRMIELVRRVRQAVTQPVTFCENYVPWADKLRPLVAELDFISLHTYPVWEWKQPNEAIQYSKENYYGIAHLYPDKPVVISEAGWTTCSNGRGINPDNASEELQRRYYLDLMDWVRAGHILTFVFAAFDEPWKGSADPCEPEKHWGLFTADRKPKQAVQDIYA